MNGRLALVTFMSDLRFDFDWDDPLDARGDELRATWARLRVLINDRPVTRVLAEGAKTVREHVNVPLYPLAEWLATHWWVLCHEWGTPERLYQQEFRSRHSLVAAREGYSLPPLSFQSQGEVVRLEWEAERLPHHHVEFLSRGHSYMPLSAFQRTVSDFLEAVVARLEELGVGSTLLAEEWATITEMDSEEQEYCRSAAALGLDPFAIEEPFREQIVEVGERVPAAVRQEFFAATDPKQLPDHARQLDQALDMLQDNRIDLGVLRGLPGNGSGPQSAVLPWEKGYEFARRLRRRLDLGNRALNTFEELSRAFQTDVELDRAVLQATADLSFFDAVVDVDAMGSPAFMVAPRRPEARRFHFCRALFEFLSAEYGVSSLVTRTASDRQKRNRAFAAEFLAPSSALREAVVWPSVSEEQIDDLACDFGVSPLVIRHQLENHEIAALPSN